MKLKIMTTAIHIRTYIHASRFVWTYWHRKMWQNHPQGLVHQVYQHLLKRKVQWVLTVTGSKTTAIGEGTFWYQISVILRLTLSQWNRVKATCYWCWCLWYGAQYQVWRGCVISASHCIVRVTHLHVHHTHVLTVLLDCTRHDVIWNLLSIPDGCNPLLDVLTTNFPKCPCCFLVAW